MTEGETGKPTQEGLQRFLNSRVSVHVRDGRRLLGLLIQYDEYMNLFLEGVEEYAGEKLLNRHKLMIVKGGNVQHISLSV